VKIDSAGNCTAAAPAAFTSSIRSESAEVIEVPEHTANFAWGDDDYRSLFITASTSLYRLRRDVPGLPVF
jgi:gluconolactonase